MLPVTTQRKKAAGLPRGGDGRPRLYSNRPGGNRFERGTYLDFAFESYKNLLWPSRPLSQIFIFNA
jgi:hypothetical protein